MKKIINLLVVALVVFCLVCINKINKLERQYNELENQIYNCMTGEAYKIKVEHNDETHYWECTDNESLFKNRSHMTVYHQ